MSRSHRGAFESIVLAPFSVLCWTAVLSWTALLVGVAKIATLFTPFARFQHLFLNDQMGWVLRLTFSPVSIEHAAGYDRRRASVFCQNHVSVLDGYAGCAAVRQAFCGLQLASHLRVPGYGWMMKMGGAIPVRGSSTQQYRELTRAFRQRARDGVGILVFPEGHRTLDGLLRPFERGVFRLAKAAALPLVPVGVRGLHQILPKGTWLVRPGKIEIYVWPQIEIQGLSAAELDEVSARIHRMISAYVERGDKLTYEEASRSASAGPVAVPSAPLLREAAGGSIGS